MDSGRKEIASSRRGKVWAWPEWMRECEAREEWPGESSIEKFIKFEAKLEPFVKLLLGFLEVTLPRRTGVDQMQVWLRLVLAAVSQCSG